jgi:NAD(P)-dependent dehydrogenase (short-subunit alcohol dehydrogenase family)
MDPNRLKGKNILITGAARGMGAANAEPSPQQGANVCLGDLDLDEAQKVADRINAAGNGKAIAVKMDVTKREDNAAAVAATVDAFGSINVGLFNAGLNKPRFFMDIDEDNWDMIMNVNTKAMWLGMQETARQMIAQGPHGRTLQADQCRLHRLAQAAGRRHRLLHLEIWLPRAYPLRRRGAGRAQHHRQRLCAGRCGDPALGAARQGPCRDRLQGREGQAYEDIVATSCRSSACPIPTTLSARPRSSPPTTATT